MPAPDDRSPPNALEFRRNRCIRATRGAVYRIEQGAFQKMRPVRRPTVDSPTLSSTTIVVVALLIIAVRRRRVLWRASGHLTRRAWASCLRWWRMGNRLLDACFAMCHRRGVLHGRGVIDRRRMLRRSMLRKGWTVEPLRFDTSRWPIGLRRALLLERRRAAHLRRIARAIIRVR